MLNETGIKEVKQNQTSEIEWKSEQTSERKTEEVNERTRRLHANKTNSAPPYETT